MNIFILEAEDYDSSEVLGVFDTREAADAVRRTIGHRKVRIREYPVLSDPRVDVSVTATVTRSWKHGHEQEYDRWQAYASSPTRYDTAELGQVVHLPNNTGKERFGRKERFGHEYWVVTTRSLPDAIAALRTALGTQWKPELEADLVHDLLETPDGHESK